MILNSKEKNGLIKIFWEDVRTHVFKIDPQFTKLIDALSPNHEFPLYLAYYSYGAFVADTISPLMPNKTGGYYRLNDLSVPKEVVEHLGYGINSAPLGLVIEKNLELFVESTDLNLSIPWAIYKPGTFFPFSRILSRKNKRIYAPNGLLTITAGARSVFMLPNIGCTAQHHYLQNEFNIKNQAPKSLTEHWQIFKDISNSELTNNDWKCCILYFSEKWINAILSDPNWLPVNGYFFNAAWHHSDYQRNSVYYDYIFSDAQRRRNLKPNPYLVDTARHLFSTALGESPGYAPLITEDSFPLNIIQRAYVDVYGLKKHWPTVMGPYHFNFELDKNPIYYSFQHPSTYEFSPKSRKKSSAIFEMKELAHIMSVFCEEFTKPTSLCGDTIFKKLAQEIRFRYFHNCESNGTIQLI